MAAEVHRFVPRAEKTADENLAEFVRFCRDELVAFGEDLDFDAPQWRIDGQVNAPGHHTAASLKFCTLGSTGKSAAFVPLAEPFAGFARAFLRYRQAVRPIKRHTSWLRALRALEQALQELTGSTKPSLADSLVFRRAEELVATGVVPDAAYQSGVALEEIAEFLTSHHLVAMAPNHKNTLRSRRVFNRVGSEFEARRNEKLPSPAALLGLAKAFHEATAPADVLATSLMAILCAAPSRVSEALLLDVQCEVRQSTADGAPAYGLRWFPSKGADPMVKWVVPSMASVVQEAVKRVRALTDSAREVAGWYTQHPDKLYLPANLAHLRSKQRLDMYELAEVLFLDPIADPPVVCGEWCRRNKVPMEQLAPAKKVKGLTKTVRFVDVERAVLSMLPAKFPYLDPERGLLAKDGLFVVLGNAMHATRATYRCLFEPYTYSSLYNRMGNSDDVQSVFDELGLTEDDGQPIRIRSHQLRHYLSTLATRGGLSEIEVARWAGRANIQHNSVYDHVSAVDLAEQSRALVDANGAESAVVVSLPASGFLVRRGDFELPEGASAHTTEFGYCVHDFTALPCQLHADCLNCNEMVCVKGEAHKEAALRRQAEETEMLLEVARKAETEGDFGADRWVQEHTKTLARLRELLAILDDPTVPPGAVVHSKTLPTASRLTQAESRRLQASNEAPITFYPAGLLPANKSS